MKNKLLLLISVLLLVTTVLLLVACQGASTSTHPSETTDPDSLDTTDDSDTKDTEGTGTTTTPEDSDPDIVTTTKPSVSEKPQDTTATPDTTSTKPPQTQTPAVTTEKPEDPTPEPDRGTAIKVTYEINNPYAGTISGSLSQRLYYGVTQSTPVSVTTNLGYKFVGWSDGSTATTREGDCPKQNTTFTAVFEYDAKELPIISLFTDNGKDITDRKNYVTGKISVYNASDSDFNFENLAMEIRGRGNYTWGSTFNEDPMHNKRPYRVKLSEKMNLLGQGNGKAKSWVLIANHCDQSLLRNQTVQNFAKSLSGIVWEPSASSVEVFLNGQYIGVYMLSEQVQINKNRINLSEDLTTEEIDFLLHRSGYAYNEPDNIAFTYDGEPYEIVSDLSPDPELYDKQFMYIQGRIQDCWDAIKYGTKEEVLELMDINSVIDTMLVHELFKNLDTGHDNFYMFASVDSKLYFGPCWDFDQCAGNADVGVENYEGLRGSYENNWFENLLKHTWFKEMFLERWEELYETDIKNVPNFIREQAKAGYNSYCRNFEKWKILGYTDENGNKRLGYKINREMEHIRIFQTYDEHYEYFAYWMEQRIVWLNNFYHSAQFIPIKVELDLQGKGTEAAPYLITSAKEFYAFSVALQNGETFNGVHFKQTADINMTEITYYNGVGASGNFAGIYDGSGHKINIAFTGGTDGCVFPYVTGTVMNLMTTGSIRNSANAAGIARSVRIGGRIINCGSTVTIFSTGGNVGGIVSSNENTGGSVIGCWFAGTIQTPSTFGPINAYYEGRETGTFLYNYYSIKFCSPNVAGGAAIRPNSESVIEEDQLPFFQTLLNRNLTKIASETGIDHSKLISWESVNGLPSPIAK